MLVVGGSLSSCKGPSPCGTSPSCQPVVHSCSRVSQRQSFFSPMCSWGWIQRQRLLELPKTQQLLNLFAEDESESDELGVVGEHSAPPHPNSSSRQKRPRLFPVSMLTLRKWVNESWDCRFRTGYSSKLCNS